jgi:hypothetical protein
MMKSVIALGFVADTLALVPAQAATMCNAADMMKMQSGVDKMSDPAKKDMAMKEMAMAKDSMMKKDEKGCSMHMEKTEGMMPKM